MGELLKAFPKELLKQFKKQLNIFPNMIETLIKLLKKYYGNFGRLVYMLLVEVSKELLKGFIMKVTEGVSKEVLEKFPCMVYDFMTVQEPYNIIRPEKCCLDSCKILSRNSINNPKRNAWRNHRMSSCLNITKKKPVK